VTNPSVVGLDPKSGEELWTATYPRGTRGTIVGGDEVAVLRTNGQLEVRSLKDGSVALETKIDPEPQLSQLQVMRSADQYIVVPSQPQTPETTGTIQPAPSGGYTKPLINGRLYAFDRHSGKPMWQSAATVEDYSLPLGQPSEVPVLVLLLSAMMLAVLDPVLNGLSSTTEAVGRLRGDAGWRAMLHSVGDAVVRGAAVMQEVTPERRAELQLSVRQIVSVTQPISNELAPLLCGAHSGLPESDFVGEER